MKNSLGVYVHIPFCNGKCAYCDFVSGVYSEDFKSLYFAALGKEIAAFDFADYAIDSVYFGGGTPSSVDAKYIVGILDALRGLATFAPHAEISVECNPESLTPAKVVAYADAGVNRLSIGLQSATDSLLAKIGRLHTLRDFLAALDAAQARFDNVSADIMLGLPGQTAGDVSKAVKLLSGRELRHVSAYALKVEDGTPLAARGYAPDEDFAAELYDVSCDMLTNYGYRRYEVSNFAVPSYECRHNLKYWRREEYKGFGIAAHSFVKNTRYENTRGFDYLDGVTTVSAAYIAPQGGEAAEETLMLALRTAEGLDLAAYKARFGVELVRAKADELAALSEYVVVNGGRLQLTDKGFYVMNEIIVRLLD